MKITWPGPTACSNIKQIIRKSARTKALPLQNTAHGTLFLGGWTGGQEPCRSCQLTVLAGFEPQTIYLFQKDM